jgi:hypothetical protein
VGFFFQKSGGVKLRTLVEDLNGNFITLSLSADDVLFGDLEIVEVKGACRGGADAELLFLLCDFDAHVFGGDEAGDTFVPFAWVDLEAALYTLSWEWDGEWYDE